MIQQFDCDVEFIKGKENIVADGFSRILPLTDDEIMFVNALNDVNDEFDEIQCIEWLAGSYEMIIPNDKYKLIETVHNSQTGHRGVEKTLEALDIQWKYRREHVKKFIRECPFCQKINNLKMSIYTHPYTLAAYFPMERLAMDSIGPLPESELGYKYILVIIDCFSRFVELYPLKSLAAESTQCCIRNHSLRYRVPIQK